MFDVTALGELLIDFTCLSTDESGYPTMAAHPGGAPANFLAAITKRGGKTALLGKVGKDAFGQMLLHTLRDLGIETKGIIPSNDVFTTMAFVTLDSRGNREFSFARKPGADTQFCESELNLSTIDNSKAFHFGTLSLTDEPIKSATKFALSYAKKRGKLITFDPNLRLPLWNDAETAKSQMMWGLQQADVVKISDEEVNFLFGLSPEEGGRFIMDHYPTKLLFVTCGSEGCWYFNAKANGHVDALKGLTVCDTTGAGDIFGGTVVWRVLNSEKLPEMLEKEELEDIVTFATKVAGISTTRAGGISSIPSDDELK